MSPAFQPALQCTDTDTLNPGCVRASYGTNAIGKVYGIAGDRGVLDVQVGLVRAHSPSLVASIE